MFSAGIPTPPDFQWTRGMRRAVPPNAVVAGYDGGEPIYIGRAHHSGALIPGKIQLSHGCCYVPWGGSEHSCQDYEVLCSTYGGQPNWQRAYSGQLPPGALQGGRTEDGEPLYVGRQMHEGSMAVGKVQMSHSCLYIPYGGKEHMHRDYEVLIAGGGSGIPQVIAPNQPSYPSYPGYPNYPNPSVYPSYPGNQPGTCPPRWN